MFSLIQTDLESGTLEYNMIRMEIFCRTHILAIEYDDVANDGRGQSIASYQATFYYMFHCMLEKNRLGHSCGQFVLFALCDRLLNKFSLIFDSIRPISTFGNYFTFNSILLAWTLRFRLAHRNLIMIIKLQKSISIWMITRRRWAFPIAPFAPRRFVDGQFPFQSISKQR